MTEERLYSLETKISYQDQTLAELNNIVFEQQKTIDRLEKSLKKVTDKLNDIAELTGSDSGMNQKPPHY
jgi:SlyX protein